MDNHWYEEYRPSSPNDEYYNHFYPEPDKKKQRKKDKRFVTMGQLIASLLLVALLCSGGTALIFNFINNPLAGNQTGQRGSIVTDPSPTGTLGSEPTQPPSSGLNLSEGTDSTSTAATETLKKCMASIVGVYAETTVYNHSGQGYTQDLGSGSGVIVTEDGYIVTNNHVIQGASKARVYLQDGTEYAASIVGADVRTDIAVLKIEATGLTPAVIGSSKDAVIGERVYAIGNPLGVLTTSVSDGIISGLDRTITIDDQSMTLMQTNAAVNPGNSGGGLFNSSGKLIGIVNAKSAGIDVEGLGFAIPIDIVTPVMKDLIDYGYVTGRPFLGIVMQNVSLHQSSFGMFYFPSYVTRAQITEVMEGSCADKAGVSTGDIVLALDGTEVTGVTQLSSLIAEYEIGDVVTLTVQRDEQSIDLTVTLEGREG